MWCLLYNLQFDSLATFSHEIEKFNNIWLFFWVFLQVLQEEKRELKAALQTQENFMHETRIQKEKLQAKLKATDTQHTVETIRYI